MKVLALAQSVDEANGWGRYSAELVRAFRALGVQVTLLVESPVNAPSLSARVALKPHGDAQPSLRSALAEAPSFVRLAQLSDVIHALDETTIPLAAIVGALARKPFVATLHGSHAVRLLERRPRIYGHLLGRAQSLFTPSRYTKARLLQLTPRFSGRLHAIPLGVTPRTVEPQRAADRQPFFLSVGSVKRRKGVLEALQAVCDLRSRQPDLTLQVAGHFDADDPYVVGLNERAQRSDAGSALVLRGLVSDEALQGLFSTARGLLMPSQNGVDGFEGFGLVHLEAAAHGLPAIGSVGCGNEDAILDGVTGFLIRQGDAEGLNRALQTLLEDDDRWETMSAAARAFAATMTWRKTATETLQHYR